MEEKRYFAPKLTITSFNEKDVILASVQKEKGENDFFDLDSLSGGSN